MKFGKVQAGLGVQMEELCSHIIRDMIATAVKWPRLDGVLSAISYVVNSPLNEQRLSTYEDHSKRNTQLREPMRHTAFGVRNLFLKMNHGK